MPDKQDPKTSAAATQAKDANAVAEPKAAEKKKLPTLGALEDDDEFEEFPASADQSASFADALAQSATGAPGDQLWDDNWDDDDVEDDFTKQLRQAIRAGADDVAMKD
ncbi:hypothetical protein Q5752_004423 [Cryptotrichosporon argae]